ncbi:hypothetical protein Tco_0982600 [Tanacetum coccineum]
MKILSVLLEITPDLATRAIETPLRSPMGRMWKKRVSETTGWSVNIVESNKSDVTGTLEEVNKEDEVGYRTNNESAKNTEKDLIEGNVRELVETPSLTPPKFTQRNTTIGC